MERLLESTHLSPSLLERPETPVPFHLVCGWLGSAARREGIEDLGVRSGLRAELVDLGAYARRVLARPTLVDAVDEAARSFSGYCTGERLWLERAGDRAWLRVGLDRRITSGRAEVDPFTALLLVQLVRRAAGASWRPLAVEVGPIPTPVCDALARALDAPVARDEPSIGIALPRELLSRPLSEPGTAGPRAPGADGVEECPAISRDLVGSLEHVVEALLLAGYPDIRLTARAIGVSVRTLQRRLAALGVAYGRLVERIRYDAAMRLISDPGLRVTDLAMQLGYADPANFTHAFRRWTGSSPRAYREGAGVV